MISPDQSFLSGRSWLGYALLLLACIAAAFVAHLLRVARRAAAREAQQRKLLETAPEGIWVQDGSLLVAWANARMAEMLGMTVESLVGRNVEEFYFPSDFPLERARLETLGSGSRQQFDRRLRRADGSEIWVLACCSAFDGGALSMMSDITDRKRAEQALRRCEQRYRDLLDTAVDGIYQSSNDGRITSATPGVIRMLGFERESDLKNANFTSELCVDPAARRAFLDRLKRDGVVRNFEYDVRTTRGEIVHVLENARVIVDENGSAAGFEATLTDLTANKLVQDQLREVNRKPVEQEGGAGQFTANSAGGETILLVEDEPLMRELSRDMLERQGYRVFLASDAAEAERIGLLSKFDLLIADRHMASTTGEDLALRLRSMQPRLRILLVAGYDDSPPDETIPTLPNTGTISRPFSADSLSRKIRQIFSA